jgi:hypothetical protein
MKSDIFLIAVFDLSEYITFIKYSTMVSARMKTSSSLKMDLPSRLRLLRFQEFLPQGLQSVTHEDDLPNN